MSSAVVIGRRGSCRWALALLALVMALPAFAHRVNVFAVVEDGEVAISAKFARGRKVVGGGVTLCDPRDGRVLASGQTDETGHCRIPLPPGSDGGLTVVLDAGLGHRAEWRLAAEDMPTVPVEPVANGEAVGAVAVTPSAPPAPALGGAAEVPAGRRPLWLTTTMGLAIIWLLAGVAMIWRRRSGSGEARP
jgi:nickel transport protein